MKNRLTEMFGIEYPIFAFSHCRDVVAAVTNAGGMGVLGALAFSPEQLELELKWIDEHVNGRPYGVDVVMPVKTVDRDAGLSDTGDIGAKLREYISQEHWDYVDKILADHGVDVDANDAELESGAGMGAGVLGWTEATGAPQIEIALVPRHRPARLRARAAAPCGDRPGPRAGREGRRAGRSGAAGRARRAGGRRHHHRPGLRGRRPHR